MKTFVPTRALLPALAIFLVAVPALAQTSALPPASVTTYPTQYPQATPEPAIKTAQITYTAGRLSVTANNSSLNQILRDISRQTGMKITGGVTEERVFGSYGPDTPSNIITALLDGTASNVLLIHGASATTPVELVLTPRHGGPTPPNPNARSFSDGTPSEPFDPRRGNTFVPNQPQSSVPASGEQTAQPINPTPVPPQDGSAANPSPAPAPADGTTTQQSPNDVKTPQQIYEQLLRLRQQQPAQAK